MDEERSQRHRGSDVHDHGKGQVYPSSGLDACGPEGFPLPRWRGYSRLPDAPHCGLPVRIGESGRPVFVGPSGTFKAAGAGELWFGPNDTDFGNNRGRFDVDVSVR